MSDSLVRRGAAVVVAQAGLSMLTAHREAGGSEAVYANTRAAARAKPEKSVWHRHSLRRLMTIATSIAEAGR